MLERQERPTLLRRSGAGSRRDPARLGLDCRSDSRAQFDARDPLDHLMEVLLVGGDVGRRRPLPRVRFSLPDEVVVHPGHHRHALLEVDASVGHGGGRGGEHGAGVDAHVVVVDVVEQGVEVGVELHVVAFPWLAFGHMLPFLELSKSLAERGHRVSFISTPRNIQRLPPVPPTLSPRIDFIPFPLPHVDNLPANAESTNDTPPDKVPYLKKALDGLKPRFAAFVREKNPNWILVDFAQYWVPSIAAEAGAHCAFFSIFMASSLAFFGPPSVLLDGSSRRMAEEFTRPPQWIIRSSSFRSAIAYRLHEARWLPEAYSENALGVSDAYRFGVIVESCRFVAVRTHDKLESDWLQLLTESIYKKTVVPVGLLPPTQQPLGDDSTAISANERAVIEWLNARSPGTVVYVAFGSEAVIASELVQELALGLELSAVPFLWAYRQQNRLPEGFEDRVRSCGLVATCWVPQNKVLAHRSVGAFFTHCGWSSVIEALQFGHPLIMLPVTVDQGLIARVLAEYKIGVEVPREEDDGSFTRAEVAEAVRMVTVEEAGKAVAAKAKEMKEIFAHDDGSSDRHMDEFVSILRNCMEG